jgi:hypothetical protein
VKALFSGVGMAAVAGLLMGAAMRPELNVGDRPEGPQMFAGWSGTRSTGPFDDSVGFAAYHGQTPDYVLGTDWTKPASPVQAAYEPEPAPDYYKQAAAEAPTYPQVKYQEPPREAPVYPSISGGAPSVEQHAKDAVDAHETTPSPGATFDEEAPPEATGDTSRIQG